MSVRAIEVKRNQSRFVNINIRKILVVKGYGLLADMLFILLSVILRYRIEVIRKNLRNSFTGISQRQEVVWQRAYYRHVADLVVEPFLINSLSKEDIQDFVAYENTTLLNEQLRSGRNIVLMTSHYANWEYLLSLPLITNHEVLAVYAPISNPFFERKMKELRSRFGVKMISRCSWYRAVVNRKSEKPAIFLMVADQRPAPPFKASVDFLGQKTFVQTGSERIAQHLNCAVVYVDAEKTGRHRYKYRFVLLSDGAGQEISGRIMARYYAALEKTISRQPALWLWSHDRWKNHASSM
jgi:KDO2-lipid IV(A) lauroyltransferase